MFFYTNPKYTPPNARLFRQTIFLTVEIEFPGGRKTLPIFVTFFSPTSRNFRRK